MVNPALWLGARQTERRKRVLWMIVLLAGGVGLTQGVPGWGEEPLIWGLIVCAAGLHFGLAIWAAFQASHLLGEARRSGALELLLATPMTSKEIVEGHFTGLRRLFLRPVAALFAVEVVVVLGHVVVSTLQTKYQVAGLPLLLVSGFSMLLFVSDLYAVGRFGLWMGLVSNKPSQAFGKTVLYVMVLPLFSFCCSIFMPLIWLLKNAIFMNYGEEQLRRHFRTVLTEGLPARKPAPRLPSVMDPT